MAGVPEVSTAEVDGVTCFYADVDTPPRVVGLIGRVGVVDETLRTRGATHLVEHAVLPASPIAGAEFNGTVDPITTLLWASGDYRLATDVIVKAANAFNDLDLAAVRRERAILRAEAARGGGLAPPSYAAMLRFGAQGQGLANFDEFGLRALDDEAIADYARTAFTRGRVALCFTGAIPDDLRLDLPPGEAVAPPEPVEIPYIRFPSAFGLGGEGKVLASLRGRRTEAFAAAMEIAQNRLQEQLRVRAGTTYAVEEYYEPLTAHDAHVVFAADAQEHHIDSARNNLIATLDGLADFGPTGQELEDYLRRADDAELDPMSLPGILFYFAREHLLGAPFRTRAEMNAARRALTTSEIARAMADALTSLLVVVPHGSSLPAGRFTKYALLPPEPLRGNPQQVRRRRVGRMRRRPTAEVLLVSDEGLELVGDPGVRVRFADCAGMLRWQSGARGLFGRDALYLYYEPDQWERAQDTLARIDAAVPDDVVIPMDERAPGERNPRLVEAETVWEKREAGRALELLEQGLDEAPEDARGWRLLAVVAEYLGMSHRALGAAERAVRLDPETMWGWRLRARTLTATGRREEAATVLEEALARDPGHVGVLSDAVFVFIGLGEHDQAVRLGERAVELHPKNAEAWGGLGWALQGAGRLDEAEAAMRRAVELTPTEPAWQNNLGWILLRKGETRPAIDLFRSALERDPRHLARWNLPLALSIAGDREAARRLRRETHAQEAQHLRALLAGDPGDARTRARLSSQLEEADLLDDAVAEARHALDDAPEDDIVLIRAASAAMSSRDLEAARTYLARLTDLPDLSVERLTSVAWLAALLDDPQRAREAADRAAGARDARTRGMTAAYALAAAGEWEAADRRLAEVEPLRPYSCCLETWRGLAAAQRGDRAEAERRLDRAETYSPCRCIARGRLATFVDR